MKKISLFFLFLSLLNITIQIKNIRNLNPKDDDKPPKSTNNSKNEPNGKPKDHETSYVVIFMIIIIIVIFVLVFIFLLVYFIITKYNNWSKIKQNDFYINLKKLRKIKDSQNSEKSLKKSDGNENSNLVKNEDSNCPSSAVENFNQGNSFYNESEKETYYTNVDDDNNINIKENKIITPNQEDLKLYKPYDIPEEEKEVNIKLDNK